MSKSTCEDNHGAVFKDGGREQVCSEYFIVEVAHEGYGVVDEFFNKVRVGFVDHADIFHESDEILPNRLLETVCVKFEGRHELHIVQTLDVALQN